MSYRGPNTNDSNTPGHRASTQNAPNHQNSKGPPTYPHGYRGTPSSGQTRHQLGTFAHSEYRMAQKRPNARGNSPPEKRHKLADAVHASHAAWAPAESTATSRNGDAEGRSASAVMSPSCGDAGSGASTPVQVAPPAPSMTTTIPLPQTSSIASPSKDSSPALLPALAYAYQAGVVSTARRRLEEYATPVSSISLMSLKASQDRKRQLTKTESSKLSQMISRTVGPNVSTKLLSELPKAHTETDGSATVNSRVLVDVNLVDEIQTLRKDHASLKRQVEDLTERLNKSEQWKNAGSSEALSQSRIEDLVQQQLQKYLKEGHVQTQVSSEQPYGDQENIPKKQYSLLQSQVKRLEEDLKTSREYNSADKGLVNTADDRQSQDVTTLYQRVNTVTQKHESLAKKHESLYQKHEKLSQKHDILAEEHEKLSQKHEALSRKYEILSHRAEEAASRGNSLDNLDARFNSLAQRHDKRLEDLSEDIEKVTNNERRTYNRSIEMERDIETLFDFKNRVCDELGPQVKELEYEKLQKGNLTPADQAHGFQKINSLVERVELLENEQNRQTSLSTEVDSLKKRQDGESTRIGALETKSASLETAHKDHRGTMEKHDARISRAESSLESKEAAHRVRQEAVEKRQEQSAANINRLAADLTRLKAEYETFQKAIEARIKKESEWAHGLESKLTSLEAAHHDYVEKVETRLADATTSFGRLEARLEDEMQQWAIQKDGALVSTIKQTPNSHSEAREPISPGELDRLSFDVRQLQEFTNKLHDVIGELDAEFATLRADADALRSDAQTSRTDLHVLMQACMTSHLDPLQAEINTRFNEMESRLKTLSDQSGHAHNFDIDLTSIITRDQFSVYEMTLEFHQKNLDQLREKLQALEDGLVTKDELECVKRQISDFKNVCKLGYQNLEHRYENMNTDHIYQQIVQWFQHTYPDQPGLLAKLAENQSRQTVLQENIAQLRGQLELLVQDYRSKITENWPVLAAKVLSDGSSANELSGDQAVQELNKLREDLSTLERSVVASTDSLEEHRQELKHILKDDVLQLETRIKKVEVEHNKHRSSSQGQLDRYGAQAQEMESRLKSCEDEHVQLKADNRKCMSLGEKVDAIKQETSQLDGRLTGFEQKVNTQLTGLEKETRGIKAKQLLLTSELGAVKSSIKAGNSGR